MTGPRIDHLGIVVPDLEQALSRLAPLFGGVAPVRRDLPDAGLRIATLEAANIRIELLEYTDDGDGLGRRVMGARPGLNHLSVEVDDLAGAIAAMGQAGFAVQVGFPRRGAHGTVAFFERDESTGLLLEVCRPGGEDEDHDGGGAPPPGSGAA